MGAILRFFGRHAANADLSAPRVLQHPPHRARVVETGAHVGIAQIRMRIDLQHRQAGILRRHRGDDGRRDRMLTAEDDRKFVVLENGGGDTANFRHDIGHVVERQFHFGECVNPDGMDVGVRFLVP